MKMKMNKVLSFWHSHNNSTKSAVGFFIQDLFLLAELYTTFLYQSNSRKQPDSFAISLLFLHSAFGKFFICPWEE